MYMHMAPAFYSLLLLLLFIAPCSVAIVMRRNSSLCFIPFGTVWILLLTSVRTVYFQFVTTTASVCVCMYIISSLYLMQTGFVRYGCMCYRFVTGIEAKQNWNNCLVFGGFFSSEHNNTINTFKNSTMRTARRTVVNSNDFIG